MTVILLVRHGQAAFGEDDYDRLCERGMAQAQLVGAHLLREGRTVAAAFSGTMRRQRETAEGALMAMNAAVPAIVDPRFDEYNSNALLTEYMPLAARRVPELAAAGTTFRRDRRLFQLALSAVMDLWLSGAEGYSGETWMQFQTRVREGLGATVARRGKDDVVAIFTSGGVIAAVLGQILALAPKAILDIHWRVANGSVTEINFGRSGFALLGFNMTAHLRLAGAEAMLTYR